MPKKFPASFLIPALVLLLTPSSTAFANTSDASLDPRPRRNIEEIGAALERWRLRHDIPGMAVAVFDKDGSQLWLKGWSAPPGETGSGNTAAAVTEETVFQAGQIANLLTAMALQTLLAEGTLSPDARVRDLVPEVDLQNPWPDEPVLVRQLLSHQAGVPPLHFHDLFVSSDIQPLLADLNSSFRSLRLEYPPGSRQVYSQAAYGLAAYLVDRGSEVGYSKAVDALLPGIGLRPAADAPRARNRRSLTAGLRPTLGDAANVELDIRALAALGRLLLRRGELDGVRLLRPETVAVLEAQVREYVPSYTAGGLRLESLHGYRMYTAAGAYPGSVAKLVYCPQPESGNTRGQDFCGKGYAILLNTDRSAIPAGALGELENFLRGQFGASLSGEDGNGMSRSTPLPAPRMALPAADDMSFPVYWRALQGTPIERFFGDWLEIASAQPVGNVIHWRPLFGKQSRWSPHAGGLLREAGAWPPGRVWQDDVLLSADAAWVAIPGWQYHGGLLAGALAIIAWLLTMLHAPLWILASIKGHVHGYHEWLPRLMPLLAQLALLAFVILLAGLAVPGIGQPGPMTYALLIVSVLQPLLALASLPAALAGVYWKLGLRSNLLNITGAMGALLSAAWLIACGLFAFQTWNY